MHTLLCHVVCSTRFASFLGDFCSEGDRLNLFIAQGRQHNFFAFRRNVPSDSCESKAMSLTASAALLITCRDDLRLPSLLAPIASKTRFSFRGKSPTISQHRLRCSTVTSLDAVRLIRMRVRTHKEGFNPRVAAQFSQSMPSCQTRSPSSPVEESESSESRVTRLGGIALWWCPVDRVPLHISRVRFEPCNLCGKVANANWGWGCAVGTASGGRVLAQQLAQCEIVHDPPDVDVVLRWN